MPRIREIAVRILFSVLLVGLPTAAGSVTLTEKAGLQAAMQRHIDRQSVDGSFLTLDEKSGEIRALHPATTHPKILSVGPYFMMCYDFLDDGGRKVSVDFLLAQKKASYVVFHSIVGSRALLTKWMQDGKAVMAE
jgi:hypothetical protein